MTEEYTKPILKSDRMHSKVRKTLNSKYIFRQPYISRVYPDKPDVGPTNDETDESHSTDGTEESPTFHFDKSKSEEDIDYDKLRTIFCVKIPAKKEENAEPLRDERSLNRVESNASQIVDIETQKRISSISKTVSSKQDSVQTPSGSVASSGSHTELIKNEENVHKSRRSVEIMAPPVLPRKSSISLFHNLTCNGDTPGHNSDAGDSNLKSSKTTTLERIKSRKFSLSLVKLPDILTGRKSDEDKDGEAKQDGASVADMPHDTSENKHDDYSRLLEPNRFAQVITVLTVCTVFGLLVALIARITMSQNGTSGKGTSNTTNLTTELPNTTGIT